MYLMPRLAYGLNKEATWVLCQVYIFLEDEPRTLESVLEYLFYTYQRSQDGISKTDKELMESTGEGRAELIKNGIKKHIDRLVKVNLIDADGESLSIPSKYNISNYQMSLNEDMTGKHNPQDADGVIFFKGSTLKTKLRGEPAQRFKLFWEAYGYKKSRPSAVTSWSKLEDRVINEHGSFPDSLMKEILRAARMESEIKQKNDIIRDAIEKGAYVQIRPVAPKYPQTWISNECWEDETYEEVAPKAEKKAAPGVSDDWRDQH